MAKSSSHERKVDGYLKPLNHKFFTGYVKDNKVSKSAALNDAVRILRESTQPVKKIN